MAAIFIISLALLVPESALTQVQTHCSLRVFVSSSSARRESVFPPAPLQTAHPCFMAQAGPASCPWAAQTWAPSCRVGALLLPPFLVNSQAPGPSRWRQTVDDWNVAGGGGERPGCPPRCHPWATVLVPQLRCSCIFSLTPVVPKFPLGPRFRAWPWGQLEPSHPGLGLVLPSLLTL